MAPVVLEKFHRMAVAFNPGVLDGGIMLVYVS